MWQIVRKQTRPNTSVQFFSMQTAPVQDEFKVHWKETYVLTDKLIYIHNEISEDQLESNTTMIWDSRESIDQMLADPMVQEGLLAIKKTYLEENGIVEILVSNTEV
jgi:hypothetical protein